MRSSIPDSDAASRGTVAAPRRSLARSPLFVAACAALLLMIAVGLFAALVAPFSPTAIDAAHVFQGPSPRHPFGTDRFGRDLLSRIVFGVRVSLGIAGASIAAALVAGGPPRPPPPPPPAPDPRPRPPRARLFALPP